MPSSIRRSLLALAATAAVVACGLAAGTTALAEGPIILTTPYPTIETQPGSTVKLDVDVATMSTDAVDLALGGLPDGWTATMRGGGFVIHSVTAAPDTPAKASLEIDVPASAAPGTYPITVTGTDGAAGTSTMTVTLDVAAQVDNGIELAADFPSLKGDPATDFSYNITVTNNTPEQQTFTFAPTGPQGWTATASPTAEARAETVTIDAGANSTVKVTATPPATVEEGSYPIDVAVTAANGATGNIELTAEVTGTPKLDLATSDQRLDVSGHADSEKRVPMVISNSGTAPLEDVKMAGTAPTGWDISFDPKEITEVKPNETAQVTAIIKPGKDAVAGDYALTVRSSAGSESSNLDLRFGVQGSRTLGIVAIGVIVVALAALAGVFVKFGRR
ncbi:MAG: NEW3 domain-containing protein [Ilumatobacteraceae bacterium]